MNQTFIDMLVAIKDPVAIEQAYNIMAAKRELLVVDAGKDVGKSAFKHSVMVPRRIGRTYPQVHLEQEQVHQKELRIERDAFKLLPSLHDVMVHKGVRGTHLIRLKDVTQTMARNGFHNGMVFKIVRGGHHSTTLRHVRSGHVAIINNRYLESFFKPTYQGPANVNL